MLGQDGWELIVVDGTKYDLFTGYNAGSKLAQYSRLVFVHDDVEFLCHGRWFNRNIELVDRPGIGFLGIAGSLVVPPDAKWTSAGHSAQGCVLHPAIGDIEYQANVWPGQVAQFGGGVGLFGWVSILDGVLLVVTKATLDSIGGFNEAEFSGFHFYDIETTFRATLAGLKNYAVPIPIFHNSQGLGGTEFEEARFKFLRKHGSKLPFIPEEVRRLAQQGK